MLIIVALVAPFALFLPSFLLTVVALYLYIGPFTALQQNVVLPTLRIFAAMLPGLRFNLDRMRESAGQGFSLATDIADYLVKKGMPFRSAHEVVGGLVREAERQRCELNELPMGTYTAASQLFTPDVLEISVQSSLASRDVTGGTAPRQVSMAAAALRAALA